jgi:hypothetical protein
MAAAEHYRQEESHGPDGPANTLYGQGAVAESEHRMFALSRPMSS